MTVGMTLVLNTRVSEARPTAIGAMAADAATVCCGELRRLREAPAAEGAGAVAGVTEIVNALDKGAGDGRTALRSILISSL